MSDCNDGVFNNPIFMIDIGRGLISASSISSYFSLLHFSGYALIDESADHIGIVLPYRL